MPGESPAIFGDALRRLATAATYLYQDGPRYWYSTQPTVTKLAEDIAEQLRRDADKVVAELDRRLREDLRTPGDFARIHTLPASGQDVADDLDARLVVLGPQFPFSKEGDSSAEAAAIKMLQSRGNTPRLFQNALVFLAVDQTRLQDLDEAIRRCLAWASIIEQRESLDLSPHQLRQAETQRVSADATVNARLPEAYQWLLVPMQDDPSAPIHLDAVRLTGQDRLAVRASKKLRSDESLIAAMAGTRLRMELDRVPLWRGDHVAVRQVAEDFARYTYLPRVTQPSVVVEAVRQGVGLLLWNQDAFGYADSYDEQKARYRGLRGGEQLAITDADLSGLVVQPDVALRQLEAERPSVAPQASGEFGIPERGDDPTSVPPPAPQAPAPKRYHGTVTLDPTRAGRDAGKIADEVVAHLAGVVGSDVKVTLEIEATIPGGASDHVVRTVTENSRQLGFRDFGFEEE